jgi:hypothetical protein
MPKKEHSVALGNLLVLLLPLSILAPLTVIMITNAIFVINQPIGIYGGFVNGNYHLFENITFFNGGGYQWFFFPIAFFLASQWVIAISWIASLTLEILGIRFYTKYSERRRND